MKLTEKEAINVAYNKLENDFLNEKIKNKRLKLLVSELRNIILEQKSTVEIQELIADRKTNKSSRLDIISKIKSRLDIKGSFGFDPDTFEVVTDEES